MRVPLVFLLAVSVLPGVIIDRIAIVIGNSIIKNSDIERDIRVTDFLNGQPLNLTSSARKSSANRLIDQVFIRQEIRLGDYPRATMEEAEAELAQLEQQRFRTAATIQESLKRYGLTESELRQEFQWHLTVLRFIDARFRPAVLITDEDVQKYLREHPAAVRHDNPNASIDDQSKDIRNTLTGEQINKLFFSWLDEQRKDAKITYFEESLR